MPRHTTSHLLATAATLCALTTGCGTTQDPAAPRDVAHTTTTPPTPSTPAKPYTIEELGAAVGCTPEFQGKPLDFRQAICHNDQYKYLLLDFDTDQGQADWLDYSTTYGGTYLVGQRWVLSSDSEPHMVELSKTLGGTIQKSAGLSDPTTR
jgi:hypothetical protein